MSDGPSLDDFASVSEDVLVHKEPYSFSASPRDGQSSATKSARIKNVNKKNQDKLRKKPKDGDLRKEKSVKGKGVSNTKKKKHLSDASKTAKKLKGSDSAKSSVKESNVAEAKTAPKDGVVNRTNKRENELQSRKKSSKKNISKKRKESDVEIAKYENIKAKIGPEENQKSAGRGNENSKRDRVSSRRSRKSTGERDRTKLFGNQKVMALIEKLKAFEKPDG